MSLRRKVKLNINLNMSEKGIMKIKLPEILPRARMITILSTQMKKDGWHDYEDMLTKQDGPVQLQVSKKEQELMASAKINTTKTHVTVRDGYFTEQKRINLTNKIYREEEQVLASQVEESLENAKLKFKETYLPSTFAQAAMEKLRSMHPQAKFQKSENSQEVVISVEVESEA